MRYLSHNMFRPHPRPSGGRAGSKQQGVNWSMGRFTLTGKKRTQIRTYMALVETASRKSFRTLDD